MVYTILEFLKLLDIILYLFSLRINGIVVVKMKAVSFLFGH